MDLLKLYSRKECLATKWQNCFFCSDVWCDKNAIEEYDSTSSYSIDPKKIKELANTAKNDINLVWKTLRGNKPEFRTTYLRQQTFKNICSSFPLSEFTRNFMRRSPYPTLRHALKATLASQEERGNTDLNIWLLFAPQIHI